MGKRFHNTALNPFLNSTKTVSLTARVSGRIICIERHLNRVLDGDGLTYYLPKPKPAKIGLRDLHPPL